LDAPAIETDLPTYPTPDYPSGRVATLNGTAEVPAYPFPYVARFFQSRADESAASLVGAGIHPRSAGDAGVELSRNVGLLVVEQTTQDGADSRCWSTTPSSCSQKRRSRSCRSSISALTARI